MISPRELLALLMDDLSQLHVPKDPQNPIPSSPPVPRNRELIQFGYGAPMEAVAYVVDLPRCAGFYRSVLGLQVRDAADGHCALQGDGATLTLVQAPDHIAIGIRLADPPARRSDTPIKLVFAVADIAATRELAAQWGGQIDPVDAEWQWAGSIRCDGVDPEGNVLQVSEPAPAS